jgi:hypothetical protein
MKCPNCKLEWGTLEQNPTGRKKIVHMMKRMVVKDKRRNPWECSVICPGCREEVEFTFWTGRALAKNKDLILKGGDFIKSKTE